MSDLLNKKSKKIKYEHYITYSKKQLYLER